MDPVLVWEELWSTWSIQDFMYHERYGAGEITWKRSKVAGFCVFWYTTKTNQAESESESQSQGYRIDYNSAPLEDSPPPAGPQPPSIQHKIKSLLLDMEIDRSRDRILVQFWAPIRTASGQIMLTASHQPFGIGHSLRDELCRFRYYCTEHQYSVSEEDSTLLGPPGRVFTLGSPEFRPNVEDYFHEEFPLKREARWCRIYGYAAIPLFERDGQCCVGVLELSSLYGSCHFWSFEFPPPEKYDLAYKEFHRCKCDKTRPETRQAIHYLAEFVNQKHRPCLVQAWLPCLCHIAPDATFSGQYDAHNSCSSSNPASRSRITRLFRDYFTASDFGLMDGVLKKLEPLCVRNDRSLVGRAYSQKKSCYVRDFSQFRISDYPLIPVIGCLCLKACFAIPLQLIHPKFDPSVLEVFLPPQQNYNRSLEAIIESLLFCLTRCSTDQVQVEKFSIKFSHSDSDNIVYLDVYQNGSSRSRDGNGMMMGQHDVAEVASISPNVSSRRTINSWQKGKYLGSGSFGTVYEAITDDGFFFAVKEVSLLDKQSIYQLEQEISLLSKFQHENIVQYYGTEKDDSKLYIFLELVTKGSLSSLYQNLILIDSQVSAYTRQILKGLNYLHDRNVVHRDIKCANILVHATGSVKLADFGLAKATTLNDIKSCKGTPRWMAPEVVKAKTHGYGLAADIWSLGCTVLEMLTRKIPYYPLEGAQAVYRIGKGEPPPIPSSLSRDSQDFLHKCLQVNPDARPIAAQLLDHPFVN